MALASTLPGVSSEIAHWPGAASDLRDYCRNPARFPEGIVGVPPFIVPRICGFAADVREPDQLLAALRSMAPGTMPGSDAWVAPLSALGDAWIDRGEAAVGRGDRDAAAAAYAAAARYFFIARFPSALGPAAQAAYAKSVAATETAGRYLDPPLTVVRIPF